MKKISIIMLSVLVGIATMLGQNTTVKDFDAMMLPALYKGTPQPYQKVKVTILHNGTDETATVQLNGQSKTLSLKKGTNTLLFEVPEVKETTKFTAKYKGKEVSFEAKPIRQWQMNFVQHTHTDIGYTRSQTEILAEQLRFIDYALDYCDATDNLPDNAKFRWVCETSWAVSEYLKARPAEQIARLKKRVKEGRIELAGMYLNFDELPDEQTLASSLYPLKEIKKEGMKVEVAMQNDVNGIGWCFSEFFPEVGVKYVNMGTHGHRALISFPYPTVFWWESPSGKKILTYRAEHYHVGNFWGIHDANNFENFETKMLDYIAGMEKTDYPFDILVAQHSGYHTDNSPPSTSSSEHTMKWNEKYIWPKVRVAVASEFFKEVENKYATQIQTIRGAWPDWWTDGFGSGAREAAISRITHSNVIANQAGFSFAKMLGSKLPNGINTQIDEINKALLFYDEHTFGFSESVRNPYGANTWEQRSLKMSYAWEAYRRAGLVGEYAMGLLQTYVPKAEVPSIAIFNPMNWTFSGIAKAYIDHQILPRNKKFEIVDANGNICPVQAGERRSDGTYWSIYVKGVPALGYTQLYIRVKDEPADGITGASDLKRDAHGNHWYGITFDQRKGTIKQIVDKETKQNLLSDKPDWDFGEFIYELIDSRRPMEQYTYPQFFRRRPDKMRFAGAERGQIWDSYKFVAETPAGREDDNLKIEFRLYNVEKKIEVIYALRKKAVTDPEAVYVAFPFDVKGGKLFLDVPGGNIEAGVDQIPDSSHDWYMVQNFASARNDKSQVILVSPEIPMMQMGAINTGRYRAGHLPQSTNIYSWPMNNYWVTNFNADQMGEMIWTYQITSSSDNSLDYATKFAWSNRIPLLTRVLPESNSGAPAKKFQPGTILSNIPENLLIVSMRPVDGENAVMLHLREIAGKETGFNASSDVVKLKKPTVCNVLGERSDNQSLTFKPWEIKFIKLSW
ncbi:glycoside hydrolase family 38 C-terminal domain-containing protein [Porphyromonadaceae bacterium]